MLTVCELGWFWSVGPRPEAALRVKPLPERDELLTVGGLMAADQLRGGLQIRWLVLFIINRTFRRILVA